MLSEDQYCICLLNGDLLKTVASAIIYFYLPTFNVIFGTLYMEFWGAVVFIVTQLCKN